MAQTSPSRAIIIDKERGMSGDSNFEDDSLYDDTFIIEDARELKLVKR